MNAIAQPLINKMTAHDLLPFINITSPVLKKLPNLQINQKM